jgi:hypothetical protein
MWSCRELGEPGVLAEGLRKQLASTLLRASMRQNAQMPTSNNSADYCHLRAYFTIASDILTAITG